MPTKPKHPLPDVDLKIGKTLATIRKDNGITQVELADKVGISQQLLSHYENGKLHIAAEMIIRFAKALEISTDEILNITPHKKNNLSLRFTSRMKELENLPELKKKAVLQILDDLIRANQ